MSYSRKGQARAAALRKKRDAAQKRTRPVGSSAKIGPRSRAGNAPNVAALLAEIRNPQRRAVLQFVSAVARSSRTRRGLLDALAKLDTPEGKALRSKVRLPEPVALKADGTP